MGQAAEPEGVLGNDKPFSYFYFFSSDFGKFMMRKILFFVICYLSIFSYHAVKAQQILWQNTIGGADNDQLQSFRKTPDGGSIIGGSSQSDISGDKTEMCQGVWDFWIVKLDASGNIQWQNTIGGNSTDQLSSIVPTSDGGYFCGGSSTSNISGDKTEICKGSYDYWVVKLDASGVIQWQKTIGGIDTDLLKMVVQTHDGGYICGGYSESGANGDKTENCRGSNDYWIVKLDVNGNIQWQKVYGGFSFDELFSIRQTSDHGFICGGLSGSDISGEKTENDIGGGDYWIIKLDSTGDMEWQNTIGGSNTDVTYSSMQTIDGGYICSGYSQSPMSGDKTENSQGGYDIWVVKLDASGLIQWQNTIGGMNADSYNVVQQQSTGDYLVCGLSQSPISGDKTTNNKGYSDFWIIHLDTLGNILAQTSIGGNHSDFVFDFDFTDDGSVLLGGSSTSNVSGDKTEPGFGIDDFWIVKITNQYNIISGKMYQDANLNAVADSGEAPVRFKPVNEILTSNVAFTNSMGEYAVFSDSGLYSVIPDPILYYSTVPLMHSGTISGYQQSVGSADFAIQSSGTFNDLCISISPTGPFRSGMSASYIINYTNAGTTTLTPTIVFFPDTHLVYQQSNVTPVSVTADSVVWNIPPMAPFETGSILITVSINPGTPWGSLVNSSVMIEPVPGDFNPGCNYSSWEVLITGSYDPNDIIVSRDSIYNYELASPPYLDYLIRFQNTGNDTAFYVRVGNNIASDLDLTSFEVVASSHPMDLEYSAHSRLMEFTFNNILLPDSNVNEPESHGFVRYRIKPLSSLIVGDSILNRADIYFDFNQPVITNTAVTEIVLPLGIDQQSSVTGQRLAVYPNPFRDEFTIEISGMEGQQINVGLYDIYGRLLNLLFDGRVTSDALSLSKGDLHGLSGGIYFVRMESGIGSQYLKIIKY